MNPFRKLAEADRKLSDWIIVARPWRVCSVSMPFEEIIEDPIMRERLVEACGGVPGAFIGHDIDLSGLANPDEELVASLYKSIGELIVKKQAENL